MIRKLLDKDVSKRYSAEEALRDSWIVHNSKNEVNLKELTKCLNNMKNFKANKKLQEATLLFMVNFLVSREEKNELLNQFKALDLNNDGRVSREELTLGYMKVTNKVDVDDEVDQIMTAVDKNQSGYIDYSGIKIIIRIHHGLHEQEPIAGEGKTGNGIQNTG